MNLHSAYITDKNVLERKKKQIELWGFLYISLFLQDLHPDFLLCVASDQLHNRKQLRNELPKACKS